MPSIDLQPTLEGDLVILRPVREEDFDALHAAASDPLIWEQHPQRERWRREVFAEYFRGAVASRSAFVVIERATGRIIGCTRYHGHNPVTREIEIGWTFLMRSHWGGRFNREMKRLMLDHAFEFVDSVIFLVAPNNIRSQTAVQRLGATRAGVRCDDTGLTSILFRLDAGAWRRHRDASSSILYDRGRMASKLDPFSGEESIPASADRLHALLTDPQGLARCIPGLATSEIVDPSTLRAVVRPGLSFLKANLNITLTVVEKTAPTHALLRIDTKSIGLTMQVEARIRIEPIDASNSKVAWQAEVVKMTGLVSAVPSALIRASAGKVIKEGWDAVREQLAAAPA